MRWTLRGLSIERESVRDSTVHVDSNWTERWWYATATITSLGCLRPDAACSDTAQANAPPDAPDPHPPSPSRVSAASDCHRHFGHGGALPPSRPCRTDSQALRRRSAPPPVALTVFWVGNPPGWRVRHGVLFLRMRSSRGERPGSRPRMSSPPPGEGR